MFEELLNVRIFGTKAEEVKPQPVFDEEKLFNRLKDLIGEAPRVVQPEVKLETPKPTITEAVSAKTAELITMDTADDELLDDFLNDIFK